MTDEITLDAPETRLERFLAAAAGMDGITLDEPETRVEKYLYKIAQGSGGVPAVEDADKGKYLHANESTGDLEWAAAGGGGGGVLVVTADSDGVLDHTYKEIADAGFAVFCSANPFIGTVVEYLVSFSDADYSVSFGDLEGNNNWFIADSENGYPVHDDNGDGGGGGN